MRKARSTWAKSPSTARRPASDGASSVGSPWESSSRPSILAGALAGGALGSAIGKIGNLSSRSDLAKELEGGPTPGSSGVVALVEDTAVVEIQKALAEADEIVTKAVNKQLAAEIDREAALAKELLGKVTPADAMGVA